jgi:hypothetical protein
MSSLKARTIASSYGEILKLNSAGLSSTLSFVEDGNGVVSPLSISTNAISILNTATNGFYVGSYSTFAGQVTVNAPLVCNQGLTVTGDLNLTVTPSFPRMTLTVANGTAPMTIASRTMVPNLNSELLSGKAAPSGNIVGTSDEQTLTNKTISGSSNTISNIQLSSISGMPTGAVVGTTDTQTITNKTLSGASNTFSAIPNTSITGLGTLSTQNANSVSITGGSVAGSTISGTIGGSTILNTTGNITGGAASFTGLRVSVSGNKTLVFPLADGNSGQIIATDGQGNLSFISGGTGGDGAGGLSSVSGDTAPTLGGNLNVGTFSILSASDRNISITPGGTGETVITKVKAPSAATDAANKSYVDTATGAITATSVGRDTAQWNASKIQGANVAATSPVDGQVLTYSASTSTYVPQLPPGGVTTRFFGFKRSTSSITGQQTNLRLDYSDLPNDSFSKRDYIDTIIAAISGFTVNASGRLIATF